MTTWRHEKAKKQAIAEAGAASNAELAKRLRQYADDVESEGRAKLPAFLREAARRLSKIDEVTP